jgi:DNA-binding NarL/FixJ family response regulator
VSAATVKTHVNHIFAKAGVRDRAQAVSYAYRHGLA